MNKMKFDATSVEELTKLSENYIKKIANTINTDTVTRKNHDEYIDKKGKKHYTLEVWYDFKN